MKQHAESIRRLGTLVACTCVMLSSVSMAELEKISVKLPESVEWSIAYEAEAGEKFIREWIPSDKTLEDTDWIVVVQRIPLVRRMSSKKFLQRTMSLMSGACARVSFNGPEMIRLDGMKSHWGRSMCSQQLGKKYGTFTDQRVFVDGKVAFVVTSELRTPPSALPGVVNFSSAGSV